MIIIKSNISSLLLKQRENHSIERCFKQYHNQEIKLPSRFLPDPAFLKYHNLERFRP